MSLLRSLEDVDDSKPRLNEKAPENNGFSIVALVAGEKVVVVVHTFDFESENDAKGLLEIFAAVENGLEFFCDDVKELKPPALVSLPFPVSEFDFVTSNGLMLAYELNPNPAKKKSCDFHM